MPVKLPETDGETEKSTEPVGVIGDPLEESFTAAVHVVDWPIVIVEGLQLTVVLTVLCVACTASVFELPPEWAESPG